MSILRCGDGSSVSRTQELRSVVVSYHKWSRRVWLFLNCEEKVVAVWHWYMLVRWQKFCGFVTVL